MVFGKVIAGLAGLLLGSWPGLLLGVVVGHLFDRGLAVQMSLADPRRLAQARETFFKTAFQLLGLIAKADGRISEQEIHRAEALMRQLGVSGEQRDAAIAEFKRGAAADYDPALAIARFNTDCAGPRQIAHTLLECLVTMALADSVIEPSERDALAQIADYLGYDAGELKRLIDMVEAQSQFHTARETPATDQLGDAYRALGVSASCSDGELKRAYRKLMSEHHPDKLAARGVPDAMMKLATEKAQEIQSAYETIKKSRRVS